MSNDSPTCLEQIVAGIAGIFIGGLLGLKVFVPMISELLDTNLHANGNIVFVIVIVAISAFVGAAVTVVAYEMVLQQFFAEFLKDLVSRTRK